MRKSLRSIVALHRKSILVLGVVLSSTIFGVMTSRSGAQIDARDKAGVDYLDTSRAHVGNTAPAPEGGLLFVVNSTGDGGLVGPPTLCDDGTGKCTLRAAIEAANLHVGNDGISISIPPSDPNCVGVNCTINLTQALPALNDNVSITGPGAKLLLVRRNAGGNYRIFTVLSAVTVTLSAMTISNGNAGAGGEGGGIFNDGILNVNNCAITSNIAALGGGIYNNETGTAFVTGSTLSGNLAIAAGGPSFTWAFGGGIGNYGQMHVTNSTVFGNTATGTYFNNTPAPGEGGGISNGSTGVLFLTNSTLAGNTANGGGPEGLGYGGGISDAGSANVKNTIVANNTVNVFGGSQDIIGSFTSEGFNLIGKVDNVTGFPAPTDQIGTIPSPLNPRLDPLGLQDNGGSTQTVALVCGSPAIDKGTNAGIGGNLTTDQRGTGFPRTLDDPAILNASGGNGTDIGAFERQQFCRSRADFDGDLKSDLSVFRSGSWFIQRSTAGFTGVGFGIGSDVITPGDYDGDGRADIAVFRTNTWYVLRSSDSVVSTVQWGTSGDVARAADYDGDGKVDVAVYRPGVNTFFVRRSSDLAMEVQNWGIAGDVPLVADFDGDNKADYGVFRSGTWHVLRSTAGYFATQFGIAGDRLVPADYDGDSRTDIAVFRDGTWYLQRSTDGFAAILWGIVTDTPAPGDYDGDGKDDVAVFRGSTGTWHVLRSTSGYVATQFGIDGDVAVPAGYIP